MNPPATTTCPNCSQPTTGNFCNHCGAALGAATCVKCEASLSPGARFCHVCGAPASAAKKNPLPLVWLLASVAAAAIIAAVAFTVGRSSPTSADRLPPTGALGPASTRGTTDLSSLTPRESADRLFNRVMSATERGDTGEVNFFAPMTLQAYALVGELDNDSRFDVGLIQTITGNFLAAIAQADSLESAVPGHLLAQIIRETVARAEGDSQSAQQAYRRFLESYDRELQAARPEYQEHRPTIDSFHAEALQSTGESGSQ